MYKAWLYCSDDVIKAINDMLQLIINKRVVEGTIDPEKGRKAIGNIILAMRKDLLGKTKLDYNNFIYISVIENK